MTEYIIEAENLYFKYCDGTQALNGLSLKIEKGKKIAILGSNGAGKSTLFLHLNGILKPDKGKIFFNNQEIKYDQKSQAELKRKVGIVFQDPDSQLFSACVYQEVSFGPMNLKLDKGTVKILVDNALKATDISDLKNKPTHFLSYGQKKRVSIADIVAMSSEVIIFDEPTEFLDPKHKLQVINLINTINDKGSTVILSTHDVNLAYEWADNIILMKNGTVLKEGNALEIFADKDLIASSNLTNPLVLDIFDELLRNKALKNNCELPKNKLELVQLILKAMENKIEVME